MAEHQALFLEQKEGLHKYPLYIITIRPDPKTTLKDIIMVLISHDIAAIR